MKNISSKVYRYVGTCAFACVTIAFTSSHVMAAKDGAESSGGLPQFDPTWFPSQIFWLAIMFAFLYIFFAKKTLPDLSGTIEDRRQQIESDMQDAQKTTSEAEDVQKDYELKLNNARITASSKLSDTDKKMDDISSEKENEFRVHAEKSMDKMNKKIEKAKTEALKEIEGVVTELSAIITLKLTHEEIDEKEVQKIMKQLNSKKAQKNNKEAA